MSSRHRHVLLAAAIVAAVVVGATSGDPISGLLVAAVAGCLVLGLSGAGDVPVAAATAGAIVLMTTLNQLDSDTYSLLDDLVFFLLLLGSPAALGRLLRRRADVLAELAARTEALRVAREEEAAAAVAEERARLAIGVHDALAHRVGEMSLQAAGASRVADDEPRTALQALARIEAAGRAALDDIRDVIGVLRADDDLGLAPPPHHVEALPAPWRRPGARARGIADAAPPAKSDPAALAAPAARSDPVAPAAQSDPAAPAAQSDAAARAAQTDPAARVVDVVVAVVVFLALAIETVTSSRLEGSPVLNVLGCAAIAAPMVWRRRRPLVSAALVFAAAGVQALLLTSPALLVTPIVLLLVPSYSVAAHLPRREAFVGLAICVAGSVIVAPAVPTVVVGTLAFAAGRAVRDRSAKAAELESLAAELERTRDAHAARARGEERLRIARELHDAVAHSMTVIVLQAGAAQRVWQRDPAAARVAVDNLGDVARETLAELRVTLRDAGATEPPPEDALDGLIARVRPLGLDVVVDRRDALPPDADRVALAVVQEALTNAARHAAPTIVHVSIARDDDLAVVTVTDAGRQGEPRADRTVEGTGTGLRGMAERVEAAGGALQYGPHGGGFRVRAHVPAREAVPA